MDDVVRIGELHLRIVDCENRGLPIWANAVVQLGSKSNRGSSRSRKVDVMDMMILAILIACLLDGLIIICDLMPNTTAEKDRMFYWER